MINKKQIISAVLLVISIAIIAGCTSASDKVVKSGDNVSVDYVGTLDNGSVFDTSNMTLAQQSGIYNPDYTYAPLSFIAGAGDVIKGFDDAVIGMKIGESKNITLTPDQAYGQYDPSLIQPVNMSTLTAAGITPAVNATLYYQMQPVTIVSIPNNTTVMIDFNHPLAGKTLHFAITVTDIETPAATPTAVPTAI